MNGSSFEQSIPPWFLLLYYACNYILVDLQIWNLPKCKKEDIPELPFTVATLLMIQPHINGDEIQLILLNLVPELFRICLWNSNSMYKYDLLRVAASVLRYISELIYWFSPAQQNIFGVIQVWFRKSFNNCKRIKRMPLYIQMMQGKLFQMLGPLTGLQKDHILQKNRNIL